jgi:hydrogenase expression/formation protein HypE
MNFPPGKLPIDVLDKLLSTHTTQKDPRVVVGARVGEDAAVIDFGNRYLVAKTDPITFATNDIGHYAIHVNANDIATMGAIPRWFLSTLLLPESRTDETLAETIFASLHKAAQEIGVSICGGHTEITIGLDRPIIVGQMLGDVAKEDLIQATNLEPNDCILLTKGLGIEATAIIANEKTNILETSDISPKTIAKATQYLYNPGISILKEARIACQTAPVKAMHDPTEGGVATALREWAQAADVGLDINGNALYISPETQQLCNHFQLDPLGVISSGALLIGVSQAHAQTVCNAIQKAHIPCAIIGHIQEKSFGLKITYNNTTTDLPIFDRDEIGKIFA